MATTPETSELTGPQTSVSIVGGVISQRFPSRVGYSTYRTIRRDPTVALARSVVISAVASGYWSVESDEDVDDAIVGVIRDMFLPLRDRFVETAIGYGHVDFGFAPYEKVFTLRSDGVGVGAGRVWLATLKPLYHDITEILVDNHGRFAGFQQTPSTTIGAGIVQVPREYAVNIPFQTEGTDPYGTPLLENVRQTYDRWTYAANGSEQFQRKIAGARFVVHYPQGSSDLDGTVTDNFTIAQSFLRSLESEVIGIAIPNILRTQIEALNQQQLGWSIEILESKIQMQKSAFIDAMAYWDIQKVRGLLLPERSVLEGQFGTKAEASTHTSLGLKRLDQLHRYVTRELNLQAVDQILAMNWGAQYAGKVRLVASPIIDEQREFMQTLYDKILSDPTGFLAEFQTIDTDAIKDSLDIPKLAAVDDMDVRLEGLDVTNPLFARMRRLFAGTSDGNGEE